MDNAVWLHTHPDGSREVVLLPDDLPGETLDALVQSGLEPAAVASTNLMNDLAQMVNSLNRNMVFRQHIGAEFDPMKSQDVAVAAIRLIRDAGLLTDASAVLPGDIAAEQRLAEDELDSGAETLDDPLLTSDPSPASVAAPELDVPELDVPAESETDQIGTHE